MPRGRIARVAPKTEGARLLLTKIEEDPRLDQSKAAAKAGLPLGLVNHLLHGRRLPSLEVACRLEARFGIPPSTWLEAAKQAA